MIKNKKDMAMLDIEVVKVNEDGFPVADYDKAYFLVDVMNTAYGVINAEVEEIVSIDGGKVNNEELHVKVLYDKTLTNVDKIMSCVRHAQGRH